MTWVLVELADTSDYGYGGEIVESHGIGEIVWGPFETYDEADAYGKKMNDERGSYEWHGRWHRCDARSFEARELTAP